MSNPELIPLNQGTLDELAVAANEEAYITACEVVGPSSPEFDELYSNEPVRLFELFKKELREALQALEEA